VPEILKLLEVVVGEAAGVDSAVAGVDSGELIAEV
jgi:hypothetical protein